MIYDVIIIGTGPAGYTAALYTSRAFLKTLMLSGPQLGGQLTTTTEVENYPGFVTGITGPELVDAMKQQAERFGTQVLLEAVDKVDFSKKPFSVFVGEKTYQAQSVIVATGASANYLNIPSEQKLIGKGVSACATCDGFFFKGKDLVVIGGGDTAMEEAMFLTRFAKSVTIIHRRETFRASPIMLERARKHPKISFLTNKVVEEVLGDTAVTGVRIKDMVSNKVEELVTQGFFLGIGHSPNTGFLKGQIKIDEKGYIQISQKSDVKSQNYKNALVPQTETSVAGVFAAGDCVDPRYRQAVVAAGQGCMAALDVERYLEESGTDIASTSEMQWGKKPVNTP